MPTAPYEQDFYLEEIIEELCSNPDSMDIDEDEFSNDNTWFPEEYVILVNGFRGSGKTVMVCYWGGWHLEHREDVEVYTNLNYNLPRLIADGFTNMPKVLDFDKMISFQLEQPLGALNQLDEIDTYLDKLRTTANQQVLTTKFLEQLRKRSLKFIFSCQFGNYLPYGTLDQVDLTIDSQDLFFTDAGRESGLQKGEKFLYSCRDKSGYVTGGKRDPWYFALEGKKVWPYFETSKIHDPTQFAKKFKLNAGEIDVSTGEAVDKTAEHSRALETEVEGYRYTSGMIHGSAFMSYLLENAQSFDLKEDGNKYIVSKAQANRVLALVDPHIQKELLESFQSIRGLARIGSEVIKQDKENIIITKPEVFARDNEEVNNQENAVGWGAVRGL